MNKQREVIYQQRSKVLAHENLRDEIDATVGELAASIAEQYAEEKIHPEDWNFKGLKESVFKQFSFALHLPPPDRIKDLRKESITDLIVQQAGDVYRRKEVDIGEGPLRAVEKMVFLQVIDTLWKEHLLMMDHLKEGIGLRGYGQRDPLRENQKEGYDLFLDLLERIDAETMEKLFMLQLAKEPPRLRPEPSAPQQFVLSRGAGECRVPVLDLLHHTAPPRGSRVTLARGVCCGLRRRRLKAPSARSGGVWQEADILHGCRKQRARPPARPLASCLQEPAATGSLSSRS